MAKKITCPKCGSGNVERISFGRSVKTRRYYWTIACQACRHVFLWTPKEK